MKKYVLFYIVVLGSMQASLELGCLSLWRGVKKVLDVVLGQY